MAEMVEQLVETWHINNRVNLKILDTIDADALAMTLSPRGGGTPGKLFRHLVDSRRRWLEAIKKALAEDIPVIPLEEAHNKKLLKSGLIATADAFEQIIRESMANGGDVKRFKHGIVTMVAYLIAHDAHHRGNIFLTLKHCGYKLDNALKYGIWEWNKI